MNIEKPLQSRGFSCFLLGDYRILIASSMQALAGERLFHIVYFFFFFPLTSSLKAALALKTGSFEVGIWIALPVCGLRPLWVARFEILNVPKLSHCNIVL